MQKDGTLNDAEKRTLIRAYEIICNHAERIEKEYPFAADYKRSIADQVFVIATTSGKTRRHA